MFNLLKFGAALTKLRYRGAHAANLKGTTKIPCLTRSVMSKTSDVMESRLKARDLISDNFHIVYRGGMDYYVHLAHHSSTILGFLGVGVLYRTFYIEDEPVQFPVQVAKVVGIKNYTQVAIMYAVYFFFLFGMRQISSKYVFRMYYNPATETYRAVKVGILPMATRTHDFQAGTLVRRTKRYLVPWWNGVYDANGTKIILFEGGFRTSADFNRMFKD